MHALIHRALAPQTLTYVWLVLTVALTLALAVAQSAIAGPSSAAGASIRPLLAPALATGDVRAAPWPAPDRAGVGCPTLPAGEEATAPTGAPHAGVPRCATARPAAPGLPLVRRTPVETSRSAALAALFGTAGPHGPPAARANATTRAIPVSIGLTRPSFTLDFSLSSALRGPIGTAVAASSAPIAQASLRPTAAAPVGAPL
jgi:hypothetical protein